MGSMHPMVAAAFTVVWGVGAGWVAAWITHRYAEGTDEHGDEVAVLGDATCPACGHVVSLAEAAPLRSVACADCGARLPASWNLVPLAVLISSIGMWWTFRGGPALWPFLWLAPVLVVAAAIDVRTFLIPKRVVWVGFAVGAALMAAGRTESVAEGVSLALASLRGGHARRALDRLRQITNEAP